MIALTLPHDEVLVVVGTFSASNSSARPQEQFLHAFRFPVVPHTVEYRMKIIIYISEVIIDNNFLEVPTILAHAPKIKYNVPMSLRLVENNHRFNFSRMAEM